MIPRVPGNADASSSSNTGNLDFFPFYGHATKFLEEANDAYYTNKNKTNDNDNDNNGDQDRQHQEGSTGAIDTMQPRPTRSFCYDWRRNLFELSREFHDFCEREFPGGRPVQVVAHSMGGLIAYAAMKKHPKKYGPGGVLVGVPFGTGIQYLQDVHKGYFTELGTCRQFLPPAQFTFSSHWSFFPVSQEDIGDSFVSVSEYFDSEQESGVEKGSEETIAFEADRSTIGKKTKVFSSTKEGEMEWQPAIPGKPIEIDFYDPEEWEKNEIGIFDPSYRHKIDRDDENRISEYKKHMRIQLRDAKLWRSTVLAPWEDEEAARKHMPPLTVCSSVSVPTPNQILRRKRRVPTKKRSPISSLSPSAGSSTDQGKKKFPRSLLSLLEKALENEGQPADESAPAKARNSFPRSFLSLLEKTTQKDDLAIITTTTTSSSSQIPSCRWEYDYASGRTVPGDGRIDYAKSFPPAGTTFKTVDLGSPHAKQCCWEASGGDLGTVWKQVNEQLRDYQHRNREGRANEKETTTRFSSPSSSRA